MPIISYFFGIIIRMYHDDHPPSHIHVEYQGFTAMMNIDNGEIIKGNLPQKATKIVKSGSRHIRQNLSEIGNWHQIFYLLKK